MSENTAKILDFENFRNARKGRTPVAATPVEAETEAPAMVATRPVWPVYWVYFPGIYVSSGF